MSLRWLLVALLALIPCPARADSLALRVVTYNAWDLEVVSTDRPERIARIGPAIASLAPDLVSFQELWVDADAEVVARDLARVGLVHTRRFPSGWVGSGLLLASRFPITDAAFLRYTLGGKPQKPWHGDWYGGKGIARVVVETPLGPLELADTHLHASYGGSDEYDLVKLAEALEASDFLGGPGERPLVLGGDLNVDASSLPFRLLASRCGLARIERDPGIDWVLFRNGTSLSVRVREVRKVLDAPVDIGNGRLVHLSDHDGVLAVLDVAAIGSGAAPLTTDPALVTSARSLLEAGVGASGRRALVWIGVGALALAGAARAAGAARRRTAKRRRILALAFLLGVLATAALALVAHETHERRGLREALARLRG